MVFIIIKKLLIIILKTIITLKPRFDIFLKYLIKSR